jgi:hypothetical protein
MDGCAQSAGCDRVSIPTKWKEMREVILDVLEGVHPRDGEVFSSTVTFLIEQKYGEPNSSYDWDDRSPYGKAFNRALEDLVEEGDVIRSDEGYMLPGVHSSLLRRKDDEVGVADIEERFGPEVASLTAQLLLQSAQERERIQANLLASMERDRDKWMERARAAEHKLWLAKQRVTALFEAPDDDNG